MRTCYSILLSSSPPLPKIEARGLCSPSCARMLKNWRGGPTTFVTGSLSTCAPAFSRIARKSGRQSSLIRSEAEKDDESVVLNKEFGYSRKDVILIGVALIGGGYGLKTVLEVAGVDQLRAGSVASLAIFVGALVAWVGTYIFRVSTKNMTYVQQLQDYENQVIQKRFEEMTDAEKEKLLEEVEQRNKDGLRR